MSASQSSDGESISLEEALQRCDGRGAHARRVLLAASAACTCGGMAGAVAPFLMTTIPVEGNYEPWATSMLASSMFAGMWAGSVLGAGSPVRILIKINLNFGGSFGGRGRCSVPGARCGY